MPDTIRLAVNGTLMRGLELNQNMLDAGATFVCEDKTKARCIASGPSTIVILR